MIAYQEPVQRHGFDAKLRAEADALLTDAVFRRSPALSQLLRYLVEETAAGRSQKLKSFVVAVDGLGRGNDFDASSDSSARVQMGRLRKTLESHYAHHGPIDESCIYLQQGSYTVRLAQIATAYPTLYRPLSDAVSQLVLPPPGIAHAPVIPPAMPGHVPFYRRYPVASACLFACLIGALVAMATWRWLAVSGIVRVSPVLELMPVDSGNDPKLATSARMVSNSFATDLPRFKLSRVRVVGQADAARDRGREDNVLQLFSRLEDDPADGTILYLRLDDASTDTLLWSREIRLPENGRAALDAIIPVLAEINGPMGIVATHGSMVHRDSNAGGYPCLLKYFEFVRTRDQAVEQKVAACFERPVKEQRMESTILAARSLFEVERSSARDDFAGASRKALNIARAAVAADPLDGSANFALARFSYLTGDCASARFYTDRTLETNPYSPMFTATLAGLAQSCSYPGAAALLDQALLTQSPHYAKGRLMLTLTALSQGAPEKMARIAASALPRSRYNRINYYLTEALIAASDGRRADAARHWRLFSQIIPQGSSTLTDKLRPIVPMVAMRKMVVAQLRSGGAFD